jgi:hypothetical protein
LIALLVTGATTHEIAAALAVKVVAMLRQIDLQQDGLE